MFGLRHIQKNGVEEVNIKPGDNILGADESVGLKEKFDCPS